MLKILGGYCLMLVCLLYQTQFGRWKNVTFYSPSEATLA